MTFTRKSVLLAGGFAATLSVGFFAGQALAFQPHMQTALDALKTARAELEMADSNKGGHRLKAIGFVDAAIAETKMGIQFAQ